MCFASKGQAGLGKQEACCLKACSLGFNLDKTEAGELCEMLWTHIYHLSAKEGKNAIESPRAVRNINQHSCKAAGFKKVSFLARPHLMGVREDAY